MGDLPSATLGLPQHWAICRSCGLADLWARDCHAQNGVECPLVTKYHHFHYGYPQCHEDDQPYQKYGNHVCNEEEWEKICYWLTGDPTCLKKVERHRRELRDKIMGTRDEGTSRHKARRIAPPGGTGSSSSTARPPHRNRPPPPPPTRRWGPCRGPSSGWKQPAFDYGHTLPNDFMKVVALAIALRC